MDAEYVRRLLVMARVLLVILESVMFHRYIDKGDIKNAMIWCFLTFITLSI